MKGDWLILYDEECGVCQWLLAGVLAWDRRRLLRPVPLGAPAAEELLPGMAAEQRMGSWHLISPQRRRWSAGAAFPPLLTLLPGGRPIARLAARAPAMSERGYRLAAGHRSGLSRLVPGTAKRRARERVRRREAAFD